MRGWGGRYQFYFTHEHLLGRREGEIKILGRQHSNKAKRRLSNLKHPEPAFQVLLRIRGRMRLLTTQVIVSMGRRRPRRAPIQLLREIRSWIKGRNLAKKTHAPDSRHCARKKRRKARRIRQAKRRGGRAPARITSKLSLSRDARMHASRPKASASRN